jgi:hypothetical protein
MIRDLSASTNRDNLTGKAIRCFVPGTNGHDQKVRSRTLKIVDSRALEITMVPRLGASPRHGGSDYRFLKPVTEAAAGRPSGRRHPSQSGAWGHQPPSLILEHILTTEGDAHAAGAKPPRASINNRTNTSRAGTFRRTERRQ